MIAGFVNLAYVAVSIEKAGLMNQLARLRWQCKRGTKELDLLLQSYLETSYLLDGDEEKALFVELLDLEDDELLGILMGELEVEKGKMKFLVEKIRVFAAARV